MPTNLRFPRTHFQTDSQEIKSLICDEAKARENTPWYKKMVNGGAQRYGYTPPFAKTYDFTSCNACVSVEYSQAERMVQEALEQGRKVQRHGYFFSDFTIKK